MHAQLGTREDPRLRATVNRLQGKLGEELGYFVNKGWDEAWLWVSETDAGSRRYWGFALFNHYPHRTKSTGRIGAMVIPDSAYWELSRVWIHPMYRRTGKLREIWPTWRERYGDFDIETPLSPAMKAFVEG